MSLISRNSLLKFASIGIVWALGFFAASVMLFSPVARAEAEDTTQTSEVTTQSEISIETNVSGETTTTIVNTDPVKEEQTVVEIVTICQAGATVEISLSTLADAIMSGATEGSCEASSSSSSASASASVHVQTTTYYPPAPTGKIKVCKMIARPDGTIASNAQDLPSGYFSITLKKGTSPANATAITSFMWDTNDFQPNTDLIGNDGIKDAVCQKIGELEAGGYYYSEESVTGDRWLPAKYNDQNSTVVSSLSDFYLYSGELFTVDPSDDENRNQNADGHIVLTEDRNVRTLVLLNTFTKKDTPPTPTCALEGYKYDEAGNPLSGWTIGASDAYMCTDKSTLNESSRQTRVTDTNGHYCFETLPAGKYTVYEDLQSGWENVKVVVNGTPRQASHNSFFDVFTEVSVYAYKTTHVDFWNKMLPRPTCADGVDNDGDGKTDFPSDLGCDSGTDMDENDRPVITVTTPNPTIIEQDSVFTDPGATANDAEDGNITAHIVRTGTVNTAIIGTYTLTYNVSDSQGLAAQAKTRTVQVVAKTPTHASIIATKIVCAHETDLPNWGNGGPDITPNTVPSFLASHPDCALASDWKFQWGKSNVTDAGNAYVGEAGNGWVTFGPTDITGSAMVSVAVSTTGGKIWVREVLKDGYVPFAHGTTTVNPVSAELYCANDVLNYDNYDAITNPQAGNTYHCVAWNAAKAPISQCSDGIDNDGDQMVDYPADQGCDTPEDDSENNRPVITVHNPNPMVVLLGSTFVDGPVTALDAEDGDLTSAIATTSNNVNTSIVGTYTVTYGVSDTQNLAAIAKSRTVQVVTQCSDGKDNDGDNAIDYPADTGCSSSLDNDENNPPVITLIGANPMTITIGTSFTDPGATATDPEDGTLVPVVTGTVNTAVLGTYTVTYTATDSKGLSVSVTRTVNVVPVVTQCSDGIDNDGDQMVDYPADQGCDTPEDNDENAKPVITVHNPNPMVVAIGSIFVDASTTATDLEDGDLTAQIVATGTVDMNVLGTYTITYNVSDSKGAAADTKTRTVRVVSECSDGINNDGDNAIDYPADTGCANPEDNVENNPPVITLIGANPITINTGSPFTDPGATATDTEEGDITSRIVVGGSVNTAAPGTYTLTYDVTDNGGLSAAQVTRTVIVATPPCTTNCGGGGGGETPPQCADGGDNDNDGKADYPADPGCTSSLDNDETDTPGGGGGGSVLPSLTIFNEKITMISLTSAKITWNTNLPSDSRVVYGTSSLLTVGQGNNYGYTNTTATATALTANHEVIVTDLPSGLITFFRPVSKDSVNQVHGIELSSPVVSGACTYLEKYLRLGYNNDPVEVIKLQRFLKEFEGFTTLAVTGAFDIETDKAVRAFQDKYTADVLSAWGLPSNTGYVYYTTKKKINEIYCQRAFPLDEMQLAEIKDFFALMKRVTSSGSTTSAGTRPTITVSTSDVASNMNPVAANLETLQEGGVGTSGGSVALSGPGTISATSTDEPSGNGWFSPESLLAGLPIKFPKSESEAEKIAMMEATTSENTDATTSTDAINETTNMVASAAMSAAKRLDITVMRLYVWAGLFILILIIAAIGLRKRDTIEVIRKN